MNREIFRSTKLYPEEILAADSTEFSIKLVIGHDYTPNTSRIVFDFSCTLGTSCPTRELNECSGYVEAYINNPDVDYKIKCWDLDNKHFVDKKHLPSREAVRMVVLDLSKGLKEGDEIELKWGETLGGFGPGTKVSSVVPRPDYKARIDIRYFDSQEKGMPDYGRDYIGYRRPVPDESIRLEYKILPRAPRRLRLIRKVDGALLIPYDVFWNISEVDNINTIIDCKQKAEKNKYGVFSFMDKKINVKPKKLDMTETSEMDNIYDGMNLYWGDIHTHSAYSIDCAQRSGMDMTPNDLMEFARYRSGLDFFAVTDHHIPNRDPIYHIGREKWNKTIEDIQNNHIDSEFVVFSGMEFTDSFGDICLIFKNLPQYDEITKAELEKVSDFYKNLGNNMIAIPHLHSNPKGQKEGEWRNGIREIEPVLELYSDHGSYEREKVIENGRAWCKDFRHDRCAEYFIKNGYKYGFVANSDDHKGHVGVNGLTAVYSKELTRDAIFEAYKKRNVYGTTNARIKLLFTADNQLMGSILPVSDKITFFVDIEGENCLKKVELFRNGDFYKRLSANGEKKFTAEFTEHADGPDNWYIRATQIDNHIAYSSPIWFE